VPGAGRLTDIGSGHGAFPPSPTIEGSPDVTINHRPALRQKDAVLPHDCRNGPRHGRRVSGGSATVNINGRPAARISDAIDCGGAVCTGSDDVFIGDDTYGSGTGEVVPLVRFVLSQIPGSTAHGYYKEPYKLFHNGSLVQEGLTTEEGVILFEPDKVTGEFIVEAVGARWRLPVRALAPADTEAGVLDRLHAMGFHCLDENEATALSPVSNVTPVALGWFQNLNDEDEKPDPQGRITERLKSLIP